MPAKTNITENVRIPIKAWVTQSEIEPQALQQLRNIASLPFVFKHVAAMPDVHLGIGATVGSVIATQKAIIPAAVGVDIGCGMMAVKTPLNAQLVQEKIKEIRRSVERSIPVGHYGNKNINERVLGFSGWDIVKELDYVDKELLQKAQAQLGSLGGGNHFVEICLDSESSVWVMLHSGSRHIGKNLAQRYMNEAKKLLKTSSENIPDLDLAYLKEDTKEFDSYIRALSWCQEYAFENRKEMMARVLKDLSFAINNKEPVKKLIEVNCHHNYAAKEVHFGREVWVTRKGAVRAQKNDLGIIPGSMGTRSYIVRGLGNEEAFQSCSHGAGRKMSRTQAKKEFSLADLRSQTQGVECRKDEGVIDEIPGAYKDIDKVMENQKDLVEVVATLKQIMCIKG